MAIHWTIKREKAYLCVLLLLYMYVCVFMHVHVCVRMCSARVRVVSGFLIRFLAWTKLAQAKLWVSHCIN